MLAAAAPGDAITNEAIAMRALFRRLGPSEIFTHNRADPTLEHIRWLDDYRALPSAASGRNVLLVHSSIGEPAVHRFLGSRPERLVVRYHNITPPAFFQDIDPRLAGLLADGRDEVAQLAARAELALADSAYNAADLAGLGYGDVRVVPLLLQLNRLTGRAGVPPERLPAPGTGPVISFVGRVAPNKNHGLLIQAFHVIKTYLRPDAHLYLVGGTSHPEYLWQLQRFVRELALPDVTFAGLVSDDELAAVYRRTTVFLCLSAHEGFGVPLVEAMAFGVPVVAWDTAAVGETVGDGGLLIDRPSPLLAAEAVEAILADQSLADRLADRGRARAASFSDSVVGPLLLEALRRLDG